MDAQIFLIGRNQNRNSSSISYKSAVYCNNKMQLKTRLKNDLFAKKFQKNENFFIENGSLTCFIMYR